VASVIEGNRELQLTGQLGDVMRESAEAAETAALQTWRTDDDQPTTDDQRG
jgi:ATP-dependent Lon protease